MNFFKISRLSASDQIDKVVEIMKFTRIWQTMDFFKEHQSHLYKGLSLLMERHTERATWTGAFRK